MKYILHYILIFCLSVEVFYAQQPEIVIQKGHTAEVSSVTFSPNGKYILTGSRDGTIKLWEVSGKELYTFRAKSHEITSVAFSPNSQYILGGINDAALLWDISGNEIYRFVGHKSLINSVAFSPDGQYILTGSWDKTAKLWDLSGQELQSFRGHKDHVHSATFSPDGKYILTGSRDHSARLWTLSGKTIQKFKGHDGDVLSVAFSPNGKYILTGSTDSTAILWDLDGYQINTLIGHCNWVGSIAFSLQGENILTGSDDQTAILWNMNGQIVHRFEGHTRDVRSVSFSPNGKYILTGSHDHTAKLWSMNGHVLRNYNGQTNYISSLSFSPDGQQILTGHLDNTAKLWNLRENSMKELHGHSDWVNSVSFSPDGQLMVTGSWDSTAKVWDINGRELQRFIGHSDAVKVVRVSPDGQYVLTGSLDHSAKLWSFSGNEIQTLLGHTNQINAITFSPKGQLILTGSDDKTAKLWDLKGNVLRTFMGHTSIINAVAISPDGQLVLTGSIDKSVKLWDLLGNELKSINLDQEFINSICFSPDGQSILIGTSKSARLYDISGVYRKSFWKNSSGILAAQFSPNGQYVLTGSDDGTIQIWSIQTGECILSIYFFSTQENKWIMTIPGKFYMSSKNISSFIHFKIGLQAYNFDQFDLRLNRPDKILETLLPLGAHPQLIHQYRQAYQKRLEKYDFTEEMLSNDYHVPECSIQNSNPIPLSTNNRSFKLSVSATDSLRPLDRLNVYVNGVPIYGIQGINLRNKNTQEFDTTLTLTLSRGENKIQVSALNQGGAESLKATTYITYDTPEGKPDLYLITIGVSDYQASGKDLQYAAKDALDIANFYTNPTGFNQVHKRTITNTQATRENILALREFLEKSQVDDQVLFYVSGHGLLDSTYDFYYATHDIDFANPSEKGILYDEIEGLLDGIPARKKLLLMDACHSGEYDADTQALTQTQQDSLKTKGIAYKGFSKGDDEGAPILGLQNSFEMMKQLFADLRRGSGATVISSSSGMQFSYEDSEWQNGAFTYVFLRGLKTMEADANGDGEVTASEIQAYVAEFVPRLTEGLQVPTFRRENLEYDFRVW